ncbi:hypothetical protein [Ralstonia pseudosolanacearum]
MKVYQWICFALFLFYSTTSFAEMRCEYDAAGVQHCKSIQPPSGDGGQNSPILSGIPGRSYHNRAPSMAPARPAKEAKKHDKKAATDSRAAESLNENIRH